MKRSLFFFLVIVCNLIIGQTNPAITKWLQNTTTTGKYYQSGNSTAVSNGILVNCQQVRYSSSNVYVNATGIPAYPTGIFTGDGNPNQAGNQNAIYKFPLSPTQNTGTLTATTAGNIGVFINGVSLFDYRDGVSYKNSTGSEAGGPIGGTGDGVWNRDAVVAEKLGFDCAKGHPAGTNYHHHQNPSAFKYDLSVISTICNTYDSEGLYTINTSQHSPLIGFAYDGFPIYGAYGYANADGTGGIVRMKSGYQLRSITVRTHYADGTDVIDGPPVSTTYPLGRYREDYEWVSHSGDQSYLDAHNGRFCVTPEYPGGIYCYFATVDINHNSAYPYVVGPYFYGNKTGGKVTTISETTTTYLDTNSFIFNENNINIYPNPSTGILTIQMDFTDENLQVELLNELGQIVKSGTLYQGTTLCAFETDNLTNGIYFLKISNTKDNYTQKIIIKN